MGRAKTGGLEALGRRRMKRGKRKRRKEEEEEKKADAQKQAKAWNRTILSDF